MSRPPRLEFAGAVYHVIARGNEQRDVFRNDADRELYLRRLAHYRDRFRFRIYAYCLMSNHVHLALETGPVSLSRIVLALHGSYAQAFNQRHARVGHLFQGRYKAFVVQKASYLLALVRYIHGNPVKAGLVGDPRHYRWSSDRFYAGEPPPDWLDTTGLLQLLGADPGRASRRYRRFMASARSDGYEEIEPVAHIVKGDEPYARKVLETAEGKSLRKPWTVEQIALAVMARVGLDLVAVRSRGSSRDRTLARAVTALLARRHCRIPLCRVAEFFHRDATTLSKDCRKLEAELANRLDLATEIASIANQLAESPSGVEVASLRSQALRL